MATIKPHINEDAPPCKCGCGERVSWMPGKGWATYLKGHYFRGKPGNRLGAVTSPETRKKQSESIRKAYAGKRLRDNEEAPGRGVYASWEFREARKRLVEGKACCRCGSTKNVHAHHQIPGEDDSLIPVCRKCHPTEHAAPGAKGQKPLEGQQPPLCKCGCGRDVKWKRWRGWATYCKGHGTAKVPGNERYKQPPLCKCGCGRTPNYQYGKGYPEYVRGHRQRVEGHYTAKCGKLQA